MVVAEIDKKDGRVIGFFMAEPAETDRTLFVDITKAAFIVTVEDMYNLQTGEFELSPSRQAEYDRLLSEAWGESV